MSANGRISVPLGDNSWRTTWPWAQPFIPGLGDNNQYEKFNAELNKLLDFKGITQQRFCVVAGPTKMIDGRSTPNVQLWVYATENPEFAYPWLTFRNKDGSKASAPNQLIYEQIANNSNFMLTDEEKKQFERERAAKAVKGKQDKVDSTIEEGAAAMAKAVTDAGAAGAAKVSVPFQLTN